jgi:hypothetical protein
MKNSYLILFSLLVLNAPMRAAQITTTTSSVTISGQTIAYSVSPTRTTGYYRLAFDSGTKKIVGLLFSVGTTKTVYTLYCADTYAEVQAFATANALTGLPVDPKAGH